MLCDVPIIQQEVVEVILCPKNNRSPANVGTGAEFEKEIAEWSFVTFLISYL